jgi:hypothetical protein
VTAGGPNQSPRQTAAALLVFGAQCAEWMRQDSEEFGLPVPEIPSLEPAWPDPGPALVAGRGVIAHLEQHPDDLRFRPDPSRAHWPAQLMEELCGWASTLEEAAARGLQFRFLLVS